MGLFTGDGPSGNVTYATMASSIKKVKKQLGIDLRKVTHMFRVFAARVVNMAG
jgi:hypothetical protein